MTNYRVNDPTPHMACAIHTSYLRFSHLPTDRLHFMVYIFVLFVLLERERETEREWMTRGEEQRERIQGPHSAQSPMCGLILWPWNHNLNWNQEPDTQVTEPPRHRPYCIFLLINSFSECTLPQITKEVIHEEGAHNQELRQHHNPCTQGCLYKDLQAIVKRNSLTNY